MGKSTTPSGIRPIKHFLTFFYYWLNRPELISMDISTERRSIGVERPVVE
jgi:hypothetical protein